MKTLPKWATRVVGAVLLAIAYAVHATGLIPADLTIHLGPIPIHVLGALNEILIAAAAIGLNGPALWPWLATLLGNPPGVPIPQGLSAGAQSPKP